MQILTLDVKIFLQKVWDDWPRSKIKSRWLEPVRFFYFPNHNRNGQKVQYAYSNWHFCCCLWTVNTMGIVVVYTHSVRPFSVRKIMENGTFSAVGRPQKAKNICSSRQWAFLKFLSFDFFRSENNSKCPWMNFEKFNWPDIQKKIKIAKKGI